VKAERPNARVGLTNVSHNPHALARGEDLEAQLAWERTRVNRTFLDPVLRGEFPPEMLASLGDDAPQFTPADLATMRGADFVGVQYYADHLLVPAANENPALPRPRYDFFGYTEMGWPVTPYGLLEHLRWLHATYSPAEVIVTENGSAWPDVLGTDGRVRDPQRQHYLRQHLAMIARAIGEGIPVTGYFNWSLLDNFEWAFGFRPRFGLIYTEFASQARYIKDSGHLFAEIARNNALTLDS
jgi:beta-glucosidase